MKLTEDQIRRIARQEASKSTRSGGGVGGGISASWVEENYISKAFFNRIFEIYGPGEHSGDPDVQIEPNDTETTISNIKALVGFWAEEYVSALGQNSEQGGGGITLNEPLASINNASLGTPTNGQTLVYRNNQWTYGTGGGSGSVTSITAGAGLSGGTITTSGTIAIDSTYQTYISHGESAYNALDNYLLKTAGVTAIVVGSGTNADKIGVTINGSNTGFITVPYASKAAQLSTARTIWGQSFDGSAAVKGDITQATCLEFSEIGGSAGHGGYIDFHYNGSTSDYTSRIIEDASGVLKINNAIFAKLSGNVSIGTSTISQTYKLDVNGYTKTSRLYLTDSVYFEYDSSNSGVRLINAGFYADTYVSALGSNSGGGGGSGAYIPISGSSDIAGSLIPGTTNAYDLGSSSKRWKNIYCNSLSVYSSMSVTSMSLNSISVNTAAIISSGAKFASICIESNSSGAYDANRSGEINRYGGVLHLQHDTSNNTTICYGGGNLLFGNGNIGRQTFMMYNNRISMGNAYMYGQGDDICFDGSETDNGTVKGVNGMTIVAGSDIRLKDIISDAVCEVSDIANAPVFNFEWKKNKKRQHLGTSAQYWQGIFENGIYEDKEGMLSMDYGAIDMVLSVMIARKVVELEQKVAELESKLSAS